MIEVLENPGGRAVNRAVAFQAADLRGLRHRGRNIAEAAPRSQQGRAEILRRPAARSVTSTLLDGLSHHSRHHRHRRSYRSRQDLAHQALTGQDTDRLKEEKERGISIDLGFAYFTLPDGTRTGIVDVPGHERFIRNMLAGAHGIDSCCSLSRPTTA